MSVNLFEKVAVEVRFGYNKTNPFMPHMRHNIEGVI